MCLSEPENSFRWKIVIVHTLTPSTALCSLTYNTEASRGSFLHCSLSLLVSLFTSCSVPGCSGRTLYSKGESWGRTLSWALCPVWYALLSSAWYTGLSPVGYTLLSTAQYTPLSPVQSPSIQQAAAHLCLVSISASVVHQKAPVGSNTCKWIN